MALGVAHCAVTPGTSYTVMTSLTCSAGYVAATSGTSSTGVGASTTTPLTGCYPCATTLTGIASCTIAAGVTAGTA